MSYTQSNFSVKMKYTSELIYNCRILQSEQPFVSLVSILEDEILIVVALQVLNGLFE